MAKFFKLSLLQLVLLGFWERERQHVCTSVCLFAGHEMGRCVYKSMILKPAHSHTGWINVFTERVNVFTERD